MLDKIPVKTRMQLLGEVTALCMNSALHSKYRINDLTNNFLPPLNLDQFRIYKKGDMPIALITWAFLDEQTENKYVNEQYDLKLNDWQRGDRLWFIDFIGEQTVIKQIEHDLKHNLFPDCMGKALRADKTGRVKHIQEYYGINYQKS
ncbi:MAG: toxin-activating lysine-acyltransferase [Rickettsiales bacterium]